jgi:probable rRNA maturation factor
MGTVEVIAKVPSGRGLAAACRGLLRRLLSETAGQQTGITLLLASDAEIRRLNRVHLGRDRTTDVLAFPSGGDLEPGQPHLGEIAISVPCARRQARRARWGVKDEMALLVTHGYLHLLGYDHETDDGAMRRLEEDLLKRAAGVVMARRALPWGEGRRRREKGARRKGRPEVTR